MSYIFRSGRKPILAHHKEIIDQTIELRKLMGWSGEGFITVGNLNPNGFITHLKSFDSLSDIDDHLSKAQSNKDVGKKISEMNSMCERYANIISEVIRPLSGISIDDMSDRKHLVQMWFKSKPGHRGDVLDILSASGWNIDGVEPSISMPLSSLDAGDIVMSVPIKSLSVMRTFEETRKNSSETISKLKDHIFGMNRSISNLIFD